jgi:DNA-binding Xre family transcriptional regulator
MSTVRLNISEASRARGVENPHQLSNRSGVGYALCYRLWHAQTTQISLTTLARVCDALSCEPGDLLRREKSSPAKKAARKRAPRE